MRGREGALRGQCSPVRKAASPSPPAVTLPVLCAPSAALVSALTYVEVAYVTRQSFDEVLQDFPHSALIIKNAAMKIAMQRAIVVVSAASKALAASRNKPHVAGGNPLMNLLQSGTNKGAQVRGPRTEDGEDPPPPLLHPPLAPPPPAPTPCTSPLHPPLSPSSFTPLLRLSLSQWRPSLR